MKFILWLATPALLYADNPNRSYWRVDLIVYTLLVWLLDMLVAHTAWAMFFGMPKHNEMTISHTLERLLTDKNHPRVYWLLKLAYAINSISPKHIKAVL